MQSLIHLVPVPPIVDIRVTFSRKYHLSISESLREEHRLSLNWINDISQEVFEILRSEVYSVQLYDIETSGNFEL